MIKDEIRKEIELYESLGKTIFNNSFELKKELESENDMDLKHLEKLNEMIGVYINDLFMIKDKLNEILKKEGTSI